MELGSLVNRCENFSATEVRYIRDDLNDSNLLSRHLYSRVHNVAVAVVQAFGAILGLVNCLPPAIAKVAGELLYLPVRVFNAVQYVSARLREYADNNLTSNLCQASRLGVGALSSATVGLLHPPLNTSFQAQAVLPGQL